MVKLKVPKMGDNRIVDPGSVDFTGQGPQADNLGQTTGQPGTTGPLDSGVSNSAWIAPNMELLASKVKENFERYYTSVAASAMTTHLPEVSLAAVPMFVTLSDPDQKRSKISFNEVRSDFLTEFLVSTYGPEIIQTGIFEAVGIREKEPVQLENLTTYIPEAKNLLRLRGNYVRATRNPYQTLLTCPVESRPFLAGALNFAQIEVSDTNAEGFVRPLSLEHILEYSKKVGEVSNVSRYCEMYFGGET